MWRSATLILVVVASAVSSVPEGLRQDEVLNLRRLLNDNSWALGRSSLVAIGSNDTCSTIFSCADCNTARICRPNANGTYSPVQSIPCPATTPYCQASTGTCTAKPDDSCGKVDTFTCMDNGHFPDTDCKVYHVCENFVPHKFQCDVPGQTYNADSKTCETSTQCATFPCTATGTKAPSSLYPSYFGYCTNNTSPPLVIDRCTGINQLNATSQLCEPICQEEGVLQDVDDCTMYYKCHLLWVNDSTSYMIRDRLSCPKGFGFDPSNFMCVSLADYPNCSATNKKLVKLEI